MTIREMREEDVDFALDLSLGEGWTTSRKDFVDLITYKPNAAFVYEESGQRIGVFAAVDYRAFGFIGFLLVAPEHRGQGVGSRLMEYAVSYLESLGTSIAMLDAVPRALTLYERLGFRKVCRSLRFMGFPEPACSGSVRHMEKSDIEAVAILDKTHFGGNRSHFLECTFENSPGLCFVHDVSGRPDGYVMGIEIGKVTKIGPLIAESSPMAEELIRAFAGNVRTDQILAGVLELNKQAKQLFEQLGFELKFYSVRMARGNYESLSFSDAEFVVGSPAKG